MNIKNNIKDIVIELQTVYLQEEQAYQVALHLLMYVTSLSRTALLTQKIVLTDAQKELLSKYVYDIVHNNKPLAYILKEMPFGNLTLCVNPPILIPRPETEEWVMDLVTILYSYKDQPLTILDMCSGTGCIGLSLAYALPQSKVYLVDINKDALKIAQENAFRNGITNVFFIESDLFTAFPNGLLFDCIVSNPPYIAEDEWLSLEPSVKEWEDKKALVADDNGLALLQKIIECSSAYLKKDSVLDLSIPRLVLEIGYMQGYAVQDMCIKNGFKNSLIIKDGAGKDRVIQAIL